MLIFIAFGVVLTTSLFAAADSPFPKAAPNSQGLADKDLEMLAEVVQRFVHKQHVVGAELLVIKNGHTVLHQGFGWKEQDKKLELKPDTIFCIRSMTKPIIGAAIQILLDEGKVALDDPIAKHLPAFANDKSRGITVRHLLTHTGGLKLSTLSSLGLKGLASMNELANEIGKNGPESKPGEKFLFSDDGADTLTALVAAVSKMPAERFVQERLLDPLGMKDTICVLKPDDPRSERISAAYAGSPGTWKKFWTPGEQPLFTYFLGSQGMYSTPSDYARFLKMIADEGKWQGKQVLSKEAVARILTPTLERGSISTGFDDRTCTYGQLMMLYRDASGKVRAFGHGSSDGTYAYAIPEQNLYVCYFNQSRGNLTSLDFEPALHRLLVEPGKRAFVAEKDLDAKAVAPLLGLYWLEAARCPVVVFVRDGNLQVEIPFQGEIELRATDNPNAWVARLNRSLKVTFQREGDKPAARLVVNQSTGVLDMPRLQRGEGLPTAEDVLKLRDKTQGVLKLNELGVVRMTGTIEQLPAKNKGSIEMFVEAGIRYRSLSSLGGGTETRVVNGNQAWVQRAALPVQALEGAALEDATLDSPAFAVLDWRPLFKEIEVVKRLETVSRSLFVLRCTPKSSAPRTLVVDAATGRLVSDRHVESMPGIGRIGTDIQYGDYKDVKGVFWPARITQTYPTPALGRFHLVFEKIETNVTPPPGAFELK